MRVVQHALELRPVLVLPRATRKITRLTHGYSTALLWAARLQAPSCCMPRRAYPAAFPHPEQQNQGTVLYSHRHLWCGGRRRQKKNFLRFTFL